MKGWSEVIPVCQEATQDVDGKRTQSTYTFHSHDGLYTFIQNGIASVAGPLCVGGNLCQDVTHLVAGIRMTLAKHTQQPQHLCAKDSRQSSTCHGCHKRLIVCA